jgi:hypothetical protein
VLVTGRHYVDGFDWAAIEVPWATGEVGGPWHSVSRGRKRCLVDVAVGSNSNMIFEAQGGRDVGFAAFFHSFWRSKSRVSDGAITPWQ